MTIRYMCECCRRIKNMENMRRRFCNDCQDKKHKYNSQRHGAKQRGIEWLFTYKTWWKVWKDSGRWGRRGVHWGGFVMARPFDKGPYSPENVRIVPTTINLSLRGDRWEHLDICLEQSIKASDRWWGKYSSP